MGRAHLLDLDQEDNFRREIWRVVSLIDDVGVAFVAERVDQSLTQFGPRWLDVGVRLVGRGGDLAGDLDVDGWQDVVHIIAIGRLVRHAGRRASADQDDRLYCPRRSGLLGRRSRCRSRV